MASTHMTMAGRSVEPGPAALGAKYIRWGLSLFIFGLVVGYGPWLHYMHGGLDPVQPDFLKNVTLWFGCPWTLAAYVAQVGSLAMIPIGLCYVVFGRDGSISSLSGVERTGPTLCAVGILAEFLAGFPGQFAVQAIYPNFYYTPTRAGIWLWLGLQGACIAIYAIGIMTSYATINRASHAIAQRVAAGQ
jgi:hypothetical protein